ncbi:MAG: efflux RND transporter periplasmic adaptor subunit [Phycisphaerales bacterium]|nr:efflux RND transporter periplasmic adaptor subunit [Phycisphaerales bacterium]
MKTELPSGQPTNSTDSLSRPAGGRSAGIKAEVSRLFKGALTVVALGAAFWLGGRFGGSTSPTRVVTGDGTRAGEATAVWTCAMHPQIRLSTPGKCPICGMELVPASGGADSSVDAAHASVDGSGAASQKKVKYACAMMCVPPMDRAGKCPVCGMEMVAVEEHGGDSAQDKALPEHALNEITLSETAIRLARLETSPVERRFVAAEVRMVGKVEYDETRQRSITSRVPGRLDRLYVDYTGVPVRKGDHLVSLYSPELLAAQQELIQSARALQESADDASADVQRVRLETLEAARQKLRLWGLTEEQVRETEQRAMPSDHLTIYAPIGGIVTDKRLVEGAYVEEGTEIYTIADLSHVWIKLDAYEMDLAWLRYGQDVEFTTEAYAGDAFRGTIAFIDPVLNPRTRTAKVRVNVPNLDGRLKPAMFVRAEVRSQLTADGKILYPLLAGSWICPMHPEVVADGPDMCTQCGMPLVPAESLGYASASPTDATPPLVIPATAPMITGARAVVYVADRERAGRYEGREVVLGPRAANSYLVREGLKEGELVVTQGNLYLDSAAQILAKPSMMNRETEGSPGGRISTALPPDPAAPAQVRPPVELPAEVAAAITAIFHAYFDVQRALSHDQLNPAKAAAADLDRLVGGFVAATLPDTVRGEWTAVAPNLRKSAAAIVDAAAIDAARAAFEGVSNSLITVAERIGPGGPSPVLVYHCPMAFDNRGARWMQDKQGVENPYFGAVMFRCGSLKETIAEGAK